MGVLLERPAEGEHWRVELPVRTDSPREARRAVRAFLPDLGDEAGERIALVVSELVSNVVRHGGGPCTVLVQHRPGSVRIEVTDHGPGEVNVRRITESSTSGRGLAIVDALAESWGVAEGFDTKTVWCEVRTEVLHDDRGSGAAAG